MSPNDRNTLYCTSSWRVSPISRNSDISKRSASVIEPDPLLSKVSKSSKVGMVMKKITKKIKKIT